MHAIAVRIIVAALLLLLCAQGLCETPEPSNPPLADSLKPLVGTFESAARRDSFFAGGASRNGVPLYTLTLKTNGTYFVFCASVFVAARIDEDDSVVPGYEFGIWRWDLHDSEVVLTSTNRSHVNLVFPRHMKVDRRDLNRLTAVDTAPPKDLTIPRPWVPLTPPYFYRKIQ